MVDMKTLLSKILDAIKVDYIIEEGTSSGWFYRKWNSGYVEMSYTASVSGTFTTWSNLAYLDVAIPATPVSLSTTYERLANGNISGVTTWVALLTSGARFIAQGAQSGTKTGTIYCRITGVLGGGS